MLTWLLQNFLTMLLITSFRNPSNPEPIINTLATSKVKTFLRVTGWEGKIPWVFEMAGKSSKVQIGNIWKYTNLHGSWLFHDVYFLVMLVETGVQENHGNKETHDVYTLHTHTPCKKLNIENDILTQFWNPRPSFVLFFSSFPALEKGKASTQQRRWNSGDMDGISREGTLPEN